MSVLKIKGPNGWESVQVLKGESPVKGVDYFTEEDKQEIISQLNMGIYEETLREIQNTVRDASEKANEAYDALFTTKSEWSRYEGFRITKEYSVRVNMADFMQYGSYSIDSSCVEYDNDVQDIKGLRVSFDYGSEDYVTAKQVYLDYKSTSYEDNYETYYYSNECMTARVEIAYSDNSTYIYLTLTDKDKFINDVFDGYVDESKTYYCLVALLGRKYKVAFKYQIDQLQGRLELVEDSVNGIGAAANRITEVVGG